MTTTEYVAPTKEQRAVAHALWADAAYKRLEATARPHPSNRLAKIVSVDIEDYAWTNGISRTGVDAETRAFADVLLPDIARRGWARIIPAAALNAVLERDNRFTLTHTGPEYGNRYANQGRRVKFWMLTHKVEAFRVAAEAEAAAKAEEARLYAEKRQAEIAAARRLADVTEEVSDALEVLLRHRGHRSVRQERDHRGPLRRRRREASARHVRLRRLPVPVSRQGDAVRERHPRGSVHRRCQC